MFCCIYYNILGTCAIDFPEFITIIAKRFGIDGVDEMEKAFRAFDENGDGLISFAEFKSYNQKIGQFLSDEEINEFIKEVDIDGDGFLNYEGKLLFYVRYVFATNYSVYPISYISSEVKICAKFYYFIVLWKTLYNGDLPKSLVTSIWYL